MPFGRGVALWRLGRGSFETEPRSSRTVNVKMLLHPDPQKFNTFNTFNTFAVVNPALDYSTLVHPQAPRAHSVSASAVSTLHPPSPVSDGRGG